MRLRQNFSSMDMYMCLRDFLRKSPPGSYSCISICYTANHLASSIACTFTACRAAVARVRSRGCRHLKQGNFQYYMETSVLQYIQYVSCVTFSQLQYRSCRVSSITVQCVSCRVAFSRLQYVSCRVCSITVRAVLRLVYYSILYVSCRV